MIEPSGARHYHDIAPSKSYKEAVAEADAVCASLRQTREIDRAWLMKKMYEPEELRRWQRAGELRTKEAAEVAQYSDDGGDDYP